MIFDQKYDSSLWLMIKSNKKVESEIKRFFCKIPQGLLLKIREAIKIYDEEDIEALFLKDDSWFEENLRGVYKSNDLMYRYSINVLGELEIGESLVIDNKEINLDCITICPFDLKEVNYMSLFYTANLGTLGSSFTVDKEFLTVPESLFTEVGFMKTPFGNITNCNGYLTDFKRSLQRVKLKNIPEDYSLDDMYKINNGKKLVRKKKSN